MFVPPACLRVIIRNQLLQLHMIHIPSVPDNHIATYSDPLGMLVVAPEHSKMNQSRDWAKPSIDATEYHEGGMFRRIWQVRAPDKLGCVPATKITSVQFIIAQNPALAVLSGTANADSIGFFYRPNV
jgi:hypothetical protein